GRFLLLYPTGPLFYPRLPAGVGHGKVTWLLPPVLAIVRPSRNGGVSVERCTFTSLFLTSLLIVAVGGAQSPSESEKPVWTMEVMRVKPDMFGFTLGFLDDNWMRVHEE